MGTQMYSWAISNFAAARLLLDEKQQRLRGKPLHKTGISISRVSGPFCSVKEIPPRSHNRRQQNNRGECA